jgi:hypothetical protein
VTRRELADFVLGKGVPAKSGEPLAELDRLLDRSRLLPPTTPTPAVPDAKGDLKHIDGPMRLLAELLRRGRPAGQVMTLLAQAEGRAEAGTEKVGRNAPCPCGSGLKYKKCHGRPGNSGDGKAGLTPVHRS